MNIRSDLGIAATALFLLGSCSLFSPSVNFRPVLLNVEEVRNGYFIDLRTSDIEGDVTTLLTDSRWLTITVTDTLLDTLAVSSFRSVHVDSTLVRRFETATQFSLRFAKPVTSVEVLRSGSARGVSISVFF